MTLDATSRTIGDFLAASDPIGVAWLRLIDVVLRDNPKDARLTLLGPAARVIYLVLRFDGEIVNGGFVQFFENTSGTYAAETLEALQRIEARRSAELLGLALTAYPKGIAPRDWEERCELLEEFRRREPAFLTALNEAYDRDVEGIDCERIEDIRELLTRFMGENRDQAIIAEPASTPQSDRPWEDVEW